MKIKAMFKAVKRNTKKFLKSPSFRSRFYFAKYYENLPIDEKSIFFESYSGNNFSGNVYMIYKEIMNQEYFKDYKKIIGVQKNSAKSVNAFLQSQKISDYEIVIVDSKKYCKALITSKYIFNNSTLPTYFIKKSSQVLINTWHGTPLKKLGKGVGGSAHEIGNTQRNFVMSDYIVMPNVFTFNCLREDFMLDNMFEGKYILDGYPRNRSFYNKKYSADLKMSLMLENTEVICYMPTWRGAIDEKESTEQIKQLEAYLKIIDLSLNPQKILYVNLHNFVKERIDLSSYKFIKPFPQNVEVYEFLAISDCLITDYSSVFFDYANMNKKIILFAYDQDSYLLTRGLYFPMEDLPFPIVKNTEELINELQDLKSFNDYSDFRSEFCCWDERNSCQDIIDIVFFDKTNNDVKVIDALNYMNSKKNILIYAGSLSKNGITSSLKGLINHVDLDSYNYTLLFYRSAVRRHTQEIEHFPGKIKYIPIQGKKDITIKESFAQFLYYRLNYNPKWIEKCFDNIYKRELKRIFPRQKYDYAIHFTGYEKQIVHLINALDNTKKIIYVHSDMKKEMEIRSNFHIPSIFKAYTNYDKIAGVRDGIDKELLDLLPLDAEKIKIVHNVNNINYILKNSDKPICFDEETESTHTIDEVKEILKKDDILKFINVARFSPEKGIMRLIKAFEKYCQQHDGYLFVIGGHGNKYEEVLEYVNKNKLKNVIIIKSLSNPFNILKMCDYFILSSHYEGLPISIMEALILQKPVICTDIAGPKPFLEKGYGHIISDSEEGLLNGMNDAYHNRIKLLKFEPYAFNKQALNEFYSLF
ncbi:MAG: glycosyltransferase [Coprobacillus sp.]